MKFNQIEILLDEGRELKSKKQKEVLQSDHKPL